jgi:hypothetical protein
MTRHLVILHALTFVLLLQYPAGQAKTLDKHVIDVGAVGLASAATPEWTFKGCSSELPPYVTLPKAPVGQAMTAVVCQNLCNAASPIAIPYAVLYDTDSCVCAQTLGIFPLQSINCFTPCSGSTGQQCGARGQSVFYARVQNAQVSRLRANQRSGLNQEGICSKDDRSS